ncbi:1,2-phenylacetyl-CoA epoxidase subunit B [Bacillus aquiflavi]|uniref:1,2-phenylacetyl-CoA epoxidase subunit B n=1 Tax=Bacillus aquiflavi TaxID=2672567 RepID=A0A6B3VZT8_9BACI|nr:1,2-phenylacetyl-CoA epoxidase subunit PaaB [Bacillus aquiflavi]MBA4537521.1 1,2-phenylacetyl-CoA epoxidase subunit B [Bacillus aquiflavi]NEY81777.1 1,2-phenylacetyl-CoA epoxidase subunit B [Bacillus aquiflavi]UAC47481.1 1,2-phenylacetyl-CoA epoxidase subunit B [Bacillus aquiflavi]
MEQNEKASFYEEFVVFSRKTPISHSQEQFTLLAPNHEIALVMAQENFIRRESVCDIWVVKRSDIRMMNPEERETLKRIDNKNYRTTKGYGYLARIWRKADQGMLDEKEILSWSKGRVKR